MKNHPASKIMFVLIIALSTSPSAFGQIPNAGFESWAPTGWLGGALQDSIFNPAGWQTNNALPYAYTVDRSSTSHTGSFALWGKAQWSRTFLFSPNISCNFPFNQRSSDLIGYYMFFPLGSDTLFININMSHNGVTTASGSFVLTETISSYTQFDVKLNYLSQDIPDVCTISFFIRNNAVSFGHVHANSYFLLDDLELSGISPVLENEANQLEAFELLQNYPNPFNPSTKISFALPSKLYAVLDVFDVLGQKVVTLVAEELSPGSHIYQWNADSKPPGVYFCRLSAGSFAQTKKLILVK